MSDSTTYLFKPLKLLSPNSLSYTTELYTILSYNIDILPITNIRYNVVKEDNRD
ncbi:hypothetical protein TMEN_83 [Trichophyton mentagrophytes]|nr:hypothetical protein TMEN_83 [Trichophyton mentagrophytes]